MQELLNQLLVNATAEIAKTSSLESLKDVEVKYLGRKGELTALLQGIANLSKEEKPEAGKLCNAIKKKLEAALEEKKQKLEQEKLEKEINIDFFDTSLPGKKYDIGHIHPMSQVQKEVETIFGQMGFTIADGPEIDSEYYNFEGLNIPADHPARDMQDTFFLEDKDRSQDSKHGRLVLRTHTSPVQIRSMEKRGAPLRIIVPGRVFRYEATDASHDTTFYQVEGMLIDENVSLADLKGIMKEFLTRLFHREMKVRFRPGYFPFVEPGIELDMSCVFCNEQGCRICKHTGWIEFMGAGMVHPNVLRAGGIDPEKYQGWAFGFGLTRLVMMRYGIDDIRLLSGGDIRFLEQF
jgi:phenylalanyl-tRNA synthetase alpha chain